MMVNVFRLSKFFNDLGGNKAAVKDIAFLKPSPKTLLEFLS